MMAVWSLGSVYEMHHGFRRLDAEFARPDFVKTEATVRSHPFNTLGELGVFVPGPFGSAFHVRDYVESSAYRYIRGQDVSGFVIKNVDPRFISETAFARLSRYAVQKDDVMISVVGTIGQVAVCTDRDVPAVFSCKSTVLRPHRVDPYYLAAYLNSPSGQQCVLRRQRGAIQTGLNIEDLRSVPVPRFEDVDEEEISRLVRDAFAKGCTATELYAQAKQLIDAELGLAGTSFEAPTIGFRAQFSEALIGGRIDADYFQIPFRKMEAHLDKCATAHLGGIARIVKGIEVGSAAYRKQGRPFLRVSNIDETGIRLSSSDKSISEELFSSLGAYRPLPGEVLLTKDGSPGVAMHLDTSCDGIISGGIVRLLQHRADIPGEYLALAINSRACRMQVERDCSGALIVHWKPSQIRKLRVPLLPQKTMQHIAALVSDSKRARRKSSSLLGQAQARVEQLIEEAIEQ